MSTFSWADKAVDISKVGGLFAFLVPLIGGAFALAVQLNPFAVLPMMMIAAPPMLVAGLATGALMAALCKVRLLNQPLFGAMVGAIICTTIWRLVAHSFYIYQSMPYVLGAAALGGFVCGYIGHRYVSEKSA